MSRYSEVGLKRLGTRYLSFKFISTIPSFTTPVDSTIQREISSLLIGMYLYIRGLLLASKDERTVSPKVPVELSLTSLSTASSSARFHLVRKKEDRRGAKDLSDPANRVDHASRCRPLWVYATAGGVDYTSRCRPLWVYATANSVDHFGYTLRLVVQTTPRGIDHFRCTPRLVVQTTPRGVDYFRYTLRLIVQTTLGIRRGQCKPRLVQVGSQKWNLGVKKTGDPEVGRGARSGAGELEVNREVNIPTNHQPPSARTIT